MNEKSLEKNLANLERELVNLQTAHEIGLGSVIFWELVGSTTPLDLPSVYAVIILVNVASGERLNPIIDFYYSESLFSYVVKSDIYPDRYAVILTDINFHPIVSWKIVSTSKLEYHYGQSEQEAEDWVGKDL